MNPDKIGKFIYDLRTEKGLSQYQLADMIPISRQAVSKWERGQTIPDSSTLLKLSEIFDVTINELLNGERIKDNSIESLEITTLDILDESNKKTKKIKRIITLSITLIASLLIVFLSYYFINSYNSIKIYSVGGDGKKFDIYEGLFITTGQRAYLKLGTIRNRNNLKINKISLYYLKKDKKELIQKDIDIDKLVINFSRCNDNYIKINPDFFKRIYIEINYNENKKENIKLNFERSFINNNIFFYNDKINHHKEKIKKDKSKIKTEEDSPINLDEENKEEKDLKEKDNKIVENRKEETIEEIMENALNDNNDSKENIEKKESEAKEIEEDEETKLDIIKEKGTENMGNYMYSIDIDGNHIEFDYFKMMNQLMMYENGELVWTYIHIPKIYNCETSYNKNIDSSNINECKKFINNCLNKYIK